ncbi:MAG: aspartate 1-decarboxylase [Elusimicrobia bacterium RIFOXYC2_FULL_34_12]|nr:MAG: aspartate 1-decarboxylase [Elusimicrobia bacterium RIFOXYC2_FULL_34_12]HAM38208.1 aspartate 1-decarboxylase [Elusimicrobiota bacterium]
MFRKLAKSKLQLAKITGKNLNYLGSIKIDRSLMDLADIYPYEIVLVVNKTTGARFETYVLEGKKKSGMIELNGGAARLGEIGDELIIISFEFVDEEKAKIYKPKIIFLNAKNKPIKKLKLH